MGCLSERSRSQSTGPYQSTGTPRTRFGSSPCLACGPMSRRGIPKTLSGSSWSPDTGQPFAAASHRPDYRLGVRSNKHGVAASSRQRRVARPGRPWRRSSRWPRHLVISCRASLPSGLGLCAGRYQSSRACILYGLVGPQVAYELLPGFGQAVLIRREDRAAGGRDELGPDLN